MNANPDKTYQRACLWIVYCLLAVWFAVSYGCGILFRDWLDALSEEEIRELAEMPYRIKPKQLLEAAAPQAPKTVDPDEEVFAASSDLALFIEDNDDIKDIKESRTGTKDSAAQYLRRFMGPDQGIGPAMRRSHHQPPTWESFKFGNDLEIKVRKPLSPAQKRQLDLAGRLLQSMLEEYKL